MAAHTWLDSSLRRSARLGLEVLDRASRRSVDWNSTSESRTPTATLDYIPHGPAQKTHLEHDSAFASFVELMSEMTRQCKIFYDSGCSTVSERQHVCRYHGQDGCCTLPTRAQAEVSVQDVDFYIEVSPGTYAITASVPEERRQTRMVSVNAGESVNLIFDL